MRHYNSALADADRGLGHGWRHGYDTHMARVDDDRLIVVQGDGRTIAFDRADPSGGDAATVPGDGHVTLGLDRAPGTHTVLARPRGTYDWQSIELHGMHSVLASIEEYLDEHCTP